MPEEETTVVKIGAESYPVEMLLANSQKIFGQPSYVVVGAIDKAGLTGRVVSKDTLAKAIASFLAQKDPRHGEG